MQYLYILTGTLGPAILGVIFYRRIASNERGKFWLALGLMCAPTLYHTVRMAVMLNSADPEIFSRLAIIDGFLQFLVFIPLWILAMSLIIRAALASGKNTAMGYGGYGSAAPTAFAGSGSVPSAPFGYPATGDPVAGDPATGYPATGYPATGDPVAGDPATGYPAGPSTGQPQSPANP